MKSGWSFRRKYFAGDHHVRRPIAERRYAFAFCRDPLTELYTIETGPPWKAAFRLSRRSPGARLGHARIGREPDNRAPAITQGCVMLSPVRDQMTLAGNVASAFRMKLERHDPLPTGKSEAFCASFP
jgi:hypothetical protein